MGLYCADWLWWFTHTKRESKFAGLQVLAGLQLVAELCSICNCFVVIVLLEFFKLSIELAFFETFYSIRRKFFIFSQIEAAITMLIYVSCDVNSKFDTLLKGSFQLAHH